MTYSDSFNEKAKQQHLQLSQSGMAEETGLQSLNNVNADEKSQSRRDKKKDKRYHDLLQLLTETQIKLQDFIDVIDTDLIQVRKDLQFHTDMLKERIALERCLATLDNDGLLKRNVDGSLKDKNLERAVTRYLEGNSMSTDLSDDARIYAVAQNLIYTYPTQNQLADVITLDEGIISTLERGKEQVQVLQGKLNDPDNLSKREVKQIANEVDKAILNIGGDYATLITQRDALLSNDTPEPNDFTTTLLNQEVIKHLDKELSTTPLPQSNFNF